MSSRPDIGLVDAVHNRLAPLVQEYAATLPHHRVADLRFEVSEAKHAIAENGTPKGAGTDYALSFGVRVLAGERAVAAGHFGRELGVADLPHLEAVVRDALQHAHARAVANAAHKADVREHGGLGAALTDTPLAPIDVRQARVPATFAVDFDAVPLAEVARLVEETGREMAALDPRLVFTFTSALTLRQRLLFLSSEGADIDQTFAVTQGMTYTVGRSGDGGAEQYDFVGHQRGWEILRDGCTEPLMAQPDYRTFSLALARDVLALAEAPPLPATDHDVTVVTDPHFNALLAHEVIGHPCEADRALKMETGYAGRSWLLRTLQDTQVGRRIGSDRLTAYSDPTLPGFGQYAYDDEGTPARRALHVERGIFRGFSNSRETATILGEPPNGHVKASDAALAPLIRMSNTVIAPGADDPADLVRDVEHGYYIAGHRIPGISESRENFRISAMKVYEIRNGQLGRLYRDGGIQADSREFFLNIDGAGTDFRLFPVPNCGKGQPMQAKRLGNGGPTLRSRARLTGPA